MFRYNLCLEASAGSGKTFALSIRYVSLLYLGAKPSSILTLTFTNKASTEMRDRIVALLRDLDKKEKVTELNEISTLTNLSHKEILKRQKSLYHEFLSSTINISTIDKFNTQILRSFSLYLSLMPDFTLKEGVDEHEFLKEFLSEVKKEGLYSKLIDFSVYEQKRVSEIFSFLDTLNQKRNDLPNIKIASYNIEKIKKEAWQNFSLLKELCLSCEKLSDRAKKTFNHDSLESLLNASWIKKESLDYWDYKKCYTPRADELLKDLKISLREYLRAKEAYYKENYLKIFDIYKKVKKKLNLKTNTLEFNDITNFVYDLLVTKRIDNSFLYFRLDSKIDHILIDEFQDTSTSQYKILEPLIEEVVSGHGVKQNRSFFYVGDVKQSIYRFRGGVKELFYYVQKKFDVTKDNLNTNYRSYKRVVEFVNEVFRDKIEGYFDQIPNAKEDRGYIEVDESEEIKELVVKKVGFLLESGVREEEIAILTFANKDSFVLQDEIKKAYPEIKTTTTTTKLLINSHQVKAIIEFLKYLYFKEEFYKANFLLMIGRDLDEKIDTEHFKLSKPLNFLIKDIVNYFKLFDKDEDIVAFIELAQNYKDIDEFIFKSESIDAQSPSKKEEGIKLLTIHKSKGLEFSHVIIADRIGKKNYDKNSMLFYYHEITLKDMYIKFPNREELDESYKKAVEADKALQRDDELNTLYVALTRAKKSIIICQKEKNSAFSHLSLTPFSKGEVEPTKKDKEQKQVDSFEYEAIHTGLQEKVKKDEEKDKDIKAINFGLALHFMLENLNEFSLEEIESSFWSMKNRFSQKLESEDLERIKQRVKNLLKDKNFRSLIKGKKHKELPLTFNHEIKQLDLVVENEKSIIVIDYKTSLEVQKSHINQVKHYKYALKAIFEKEVFGYVCYVRDDEVEMVLVE